MTTVRNSEKVIHEMSVREVGLSGIQLRFDGLGDKYILDGLGDKYYPIVPPEYYRSTQPGRVTQLLAAIEPWERKS